ncbi:TonB-dependent receptor [Sphingobium sp. 3R8]|uniref:TonB-dependent receptor n=1 Tax=Sphingobium sp. 3R8 TaxID=2874921 RepID=UPI0029620BBE|nr:TonB-dependent receptor plug domain-containing protein [Sphingobium sp. 3R8]
MNGKRQLACGIATIGLLAAVPAFGQDAPGAGDEGQSNEKIASPADIVVTAQRREQSLSKVPVAVSAFNADTLQSRNVASEQDLAALVPGLVVKSGQNSNQLNFTLRGQTLDPFSGSSPAVLTYINEAPATEGNTSTAFFDFSSVQVLKGPQGTLFGRNATGGAILYETTKPGDDFGGFLTVKGGQRNYIQVQGAVDIPVSDIIKVRVAGDYNKQDGYIRNIKTGNTLGDTDSLSGRITVVLEPRDGFKMTTVAQYSDFGGSEGAGGLYSYHKVGEVNNGYVLNSTLDTLYGTNSPFAPLIGDGPRGDGTWPGAVAGYLAWQQANPYKVWLSYDLPHKAHTAFITNTVEAEIGDDVVLKNIFNYADAFARTPGILTGSPFGSLTLVGPHNGSAFCNVGVCGALQAEWVTQMLCYMKAGNYSRSQPSQAAEKQWTDAVYADFARTLMADTNAWWVKVTHKPDGTTVRRTLVYVGGGPEYRKRCEEVAYGDYEGFELA